MKERNLLNFVPATDCLWETNANGGVNLLVPRFKNRMMRRLAVRLGKSEYVKVELDEKGSRVWLLIDGRRTVEEIGSMDKKGPGETVQQAYDRLGEFIGILTRNGFIVFKN